MAIEDEDRERRIIDTVRYNALDEPIVIVDLFAGGGGLSEGLAQAAEELRLELGVEVELHAINHSEAAIETHKANHPWAEHYHAKIEAIHPPDVAEPGTVTVLSGGPSCTHHSNARGGKPKEEQMRTSAWNVLKWVDQLQPEHVLLENVPEFRSWDAIDPETQTSPKNGGVFKKFCEFLEELGLTVAQGDHKYEYGRVLRCANFGDPTTRRRLFLIASRNHKPTYPEPTHAEDPEDGKQPWRTAAEVVDWSDRGSSLWTRDLEQSNVTPPKNSTCKRIAEGIRRHFPQRPEILALLSAVSSIGNDRDVEEGNDVLHIDDLRERVVPLEYADVAADVFDGPFLVRVPGTERLGLTSPFVLRQQGGGVPSSVPDSPLPTISKRGAIQLVDPETRPLIQPKNGSYRGIHSNRLYPPESQPTHTITKDPRTKLVTPETFLVPGYNERPGQRPRTRSIDRPLMTVPATRSPAALTSAFIDDFEGPADSMGEPVGTLTKRDRFALCVPEFWPWGLDIRYRMLKPSELKQAQGFPEDYEIVADTKTKKKELIGNAVPVNTAKALFKHILTIDDPNLSHFGGGMQGNPDAEIPEYSEVVSSDD